MQKVPVVELILQDGVLNEELSCYTPQPNTILLREQLRKPLVSFAARWKPF